MKQFFSFILICATGSFTAAFAQCNPPDFGALESIIVEKYYVSDANDATDTDGGSLSPGSVTWRVFADLKPNYTLLSVFGNPNNELRFATTTEFFNNEDRGDISGSLIPANRLGDNTVALDSYVSIGAASTVHWGIPKENDTDGSIVGGANNDGGSASIAAGLIANEDASAGTPVTTADGLFLGTTPPIVTLVPGAAAFEVFNDMNGGPVFSSNNDAYAVLGSVVGPTEDNQILLGQFTTDGDFSFKLNVQVGIPSELVGSNPTCKTNIRYFANLTEADLALGNGTSVSWAASSLPDLIFNSTSVSTADRRVGSPDFDIYPNPGSDMTYLKINGDSQSTMGYTLFDAYGKVLMQKNNIAAQENHRESIDISSLASGIYFIRVKRGDSVSTKSLVKN